MICYLFPEPKYLLFSGDVPALLYYAQIPATIIALLLSFYIFWHGKNFLLNRLLFLIAVLFSLWTFTTLIGWTNIHSNFIMFTWSFFGPILSFIAVFCIYFIYVFLTKEDVDFRLKIFFLLLLAPVLIFSTTNLNISGFNITNCDAFDFEWLPFKLYSTMLGVLAMVWILILLIRKYHTVDFNFRKQIVFMGIGIELFLFSFFGMEFLATYLTRIGILTDSGLELYGMFGMVIFMIYISVLVVRFKTFNVKLLATQALVWGLIVLIGSQFFFIKVTVNFVLNGIGFLAAIILGQYLVKSVKREVQQREMLEKLRLRLEESNLNLGDSNDKLKDLLKQRESLVHLVTHKVKGSFTRSKYIFAEMINGTFGEITPMLKKIAGQGLESDIAGIETVDLVLNASNLQTGTVKYDMKPLDLKPLVQKVFEGQKGPAESKGLEISFDIQEGVYNTSGDAFWLNEVVHNLIDNSVKYTLTGKVSVSLERKEDKILFSVKDTGVGITEEDKKNLFTEGGRGKESVKINVDSTGYGLYTVKLIAEAHGGRVWAESEGAGKGSQFYLELKAS